MAQMKISIPFALKEWADQKIAEGRYASMSALCCELLEEDMRLAALKAARRGTAGSATKSER